MLTLMQLKYVETKPTQWSKVQKDKQRSAKHTHKANDRLT